MNTQNVNVKTATKESSERWVMSGAEPIAAKVLAFHGQDASYAFTHDMAHATERRYFPDRESSKFAASSDG